MVYALILFNSVSEYDLMLIPIMIYVSMMQYFTYRMTVMAPQMLITLLDYHECIMSTKYQNLIIFT